MVKEDWCLSSGTKKADCDCATRPRPPPPHLCSLLALSSSFIHDPSPCFPLLNLLLPSMTLHNLVRRGMDVVALARDDQPDDGSDRPRMSPLAVIVITLTFLAFVGLMFSTTHRKRSRPLLTHSCSHLVYVRPCHPHPLHD